MIEICKMGQKTGMGKFIHKKLVLYFTQAEKKERKKDFFTVFFKLPSFEVVRNTNVYSKNNNTDGEAIMFF